MIMWRYWSRRRRILLVGALPVLVVVALLVGIAPWGETLSITSSCKLSIETSIALAAYLPPDMGQPEILGSPGPGLLGSVTTNVSSSNRSQASFSHTTPDGTDILVVIVMCRGDQSVRSATYGGQSLTLGVKTSSTSNKDESVEVWYLVSPPTGSNTVVVNYALSDNPDGIAVLSYTGVDTADPIGRCLHHVLRRLGEPAQGPSARCDALRVVGRLGPIAERWRGLAVGICSAGNYLAGTIWPPVIEHFIEAAGT